MAINYTGVDLDRYNAGNKFYSQDRYLQGTGLNKAPITFNQSNTGIMGAYNPYVPIIPEDGGDGVIDPRGPGYGYTSLFDSTKNNKNNQDWLDDIGEGTIDDEDMPKGPGLSKMDLAKAAASYMFTGPFGAGGSLFRSSNRNEQAEIDKINAKINAQYGTPSSESGSIDYGDSGYEGMSEAASDQEVSEGGRGSRMAYGGRAGYADGGYSSQDNEEQQAQDQASFDAGNRSDDYNDMYSDNDVPTFNPQSGPTNYSNFDFGLRNNADVVANWNTKYGRLSGILDTDETIKGGSPKGSLSYNGSIGPGNFNATYNLGDRGPTLGYTGNINPNTTFGANYNPDGTYGMGINFNKKFNNGGIVGLYR